MKNLAEHKADIWKASLSGGCQEADSQAKLLSTGAPELDRLLGGGIPRGAIVEVGGAASCGRGGLYLGLLKEVTARGELAAFVDAFDTLDPILAESAGVSLKRLLWVRCRGNSSRDSLSRALKAADILAQGGGFGLVVLELRRADRSESSGPLPALARNCWFRLQRALKGTPTACLVLPERLQAGSAAKLALNFQKPSVQWEAEQDPDQERVVPIGQVESSGALDAVRRKAPKVLRGIRGEIERVRGGRWERALFRCAC